MNSNIFYFNINFVINRCFTRCENCTARFLSMLKCSFNSSECRFASLPLVCCVKQRYSSWVIITNNKYTFLLYSVKTTESVCELWSLQAFNDKVRRLIVLCHAEGLRENRNRNLAIAATTSWTFSSVQILGLLTSNYCSLTRAVNKREKRREKPKTNSSHGAIKNSKGSQLCDYSVGLLERPYVWSLIIVEARSPSAFLNTWSVRLQSYSTSSFWVAFYVDKLIGSFVERI